ncbi:MAG: exodeoxyribonuclease VII large subunit [Gammaproteobacteria bacterium]|nr:exodeoxyribonuclease VII large subunit [Gammaproteobacteria bacterium]
MNNTDTETNFNNRDIYTISRLNREVRTVLEGSFPLIWLEAEVSNFSCPASGHWYFSLKDEAAQVRCAMFRNQNRLLRFRPENGMQVLVRAHIGLYEARGEFQIIIEHMEEAGNGALQRAFDQLKLKLHKEGMFDPLHKKLIPSLPHCVGVITSATGAAIHDIITTLNRRFPALPVIIYPVAVQGEGAAKEISDMIRTAENRKECDVLILARGGGSLEDLWAFNEEILARAIYECSIPIVSGIGHEVDFTIADFVADYRAPTPTAAAEMVSPDQYSLLQQLQQQQAKITSLIQRKLQLSQQKLDWLNKRLPHPVRKLHDIAQRLDETEQRLILAQSHTIKHKQAEIKLLYNSLRQHNPVHKLEKIKLRQVELETRLHNVTKFTLQQKHLELQHAAHNLHAVSPLATLNRGYAIITRQDNNKLIQSSAQLKPGQKVLNRLAKGKFVSIIESIEP